MARARSSEQETSTVGISIIGPDMKVVGDVRTEAQMRVDGTIEGSIVASRSVLIGTAGVVTGSVAALDVVVAGRVAGDLTEESRLELRATARVDGRIRASRMSVDEGAVLNAAVHMISSAEAEAELMSDLPEIWRVSMTDLAQRPASDRGRLLHGVLDLATDAAGGERAAEVVLHGGLESPPEESSHEP